MKKSLKTLAMWLIMGIILIVLISSILDNSQTKMTYSELIAKIASGEVTEIEISSDKNIAYVTLKGDTTSATKEVAIPSLDSFMDEISENIVSGQLVLSQEEESVVITYESKSKWK